MNPRFALALLLVVGALFGGSQAQAQANAANYSFTTTTSGSLTDMSSGTTTLLGSNLDDTASAVTLIGFDFYFMGVRQDRFSVNSNGTLRFGATTISNTLYDPLGQATQSLVTAYGADQRTHVSGRVHFKVTGSAPNRVAVIEWLNMQSDFNAGGTADLTYQMRLAESTGSIEFVYGAMTMGAAGAADPNSSSPQFGLSSNNAVGTVGSVTAAQSGTPAPSYGGASATPVNNLYVAGAIPVLTSVADGARRTFLLSPPAINPPGAPLTFTGITATGMTLNWADSSNEAGYAVYVSTDGVNYSFFNTAAQNATSFAASGLLGATNYSWRVHAVNEGNTSFIAGSQATLVPTPNASLATGLWSSPGTWSTGAVPSINDAVTIAAGTTVTIDTAATAYSVALPGTLQFEQTTARTLTVATDVNIAGGGTFSSNAAGTQTGHSLSLSGNLVNGGTLDFSTNADTAGAGITFTGTANTSFTGTGATTDIRQITVNKGTTPAAIIELMPTNFTVRGVTTDTVVGGWLVMTNGTLKLSGSFTASSRVFAAAAYTVPVSFGFWLNNPNYTVAGQNGSPTLNGSLRVSQGTFNIGTAAGNSMGFSTGSSIVIEGGAVNATGRFGVAAAGNTIGYTQSNGTVTVCTIGNASTTLGSFDLGTSPNSSIAFSGGSVVVQINATTIDYRNQAGTGITGVTGGSTLQLGNAASGAAKNFNLRGVLPNVVVTNTSAGHTATMSTTLVNFNNISRNITINAGATFNTNNGIFLMGGTTLTNNGTLTATGATTNFIWFDIPTGAQTYTGTGVVTAPITTMSIQNVNSVGFASATNQVTVGRLNVLYGGVTGANKLTLGNGGATTAIIQHGVAGAVDPVFGLDAAPVFNPGTGGMNLFYAPELTGRTTGPEVPPSRTLNILSVTNPNDLTIAGGDIAVTGGGAGALNLGGGRIVTGANTLYFNSAAGTVARTTGHVDGNFRKSYAGAASKTFEVGTANGYSPVVFNATAGTFPTDVTVAAVQSAASGLQPAAKAINRHWLLNATGVTADVTFSYLDPADLPGTLTEANLRALRQGSLSPSDYSDQGGSVDTGANTHTIANVSTFSAWTLGEAEADLSITKTDGVTSVTPGGSLTYTITASNAGTVGNPAAGITDTFPADLTCSTTCVGALGGTCTAGPFAGNISDSANLPAGASVTYTSSCNVSASATGSISNTASIAGGAVTDPDPANNSATDTDTVALQADLSITKTDGVTTLIAGGSATYTITASNAGPSAATGATVADTFPASLTCTWTCVGAGGGTCTAGPVAGNINDTTVNLPAGGSVTYTASCGLSAAATGMLSNTATVTAPGGTTDPDPANNSATDTDTIQQDIDLSITKTDGVTTVEAGGSLTYTITASNAGPSNATGATVADTFPASLTCNWNCVGAGGGTCTAGPMAGNINDTVNLPAGGSTTYTASCTLSAAATGNLSNTATVAAPAGATETAPANNSATDTDTIDVRTDLSITKTDGVTSAAPGGSVTYTITTSNAGPSDAIGATVADTFPASETCSWTCTGAGGGTCTAGPMAGNIGESVNLPAGGSTTFTASCTIAASATGTLVNTATVAAPAGATDPAPGNNSATDSDTLDPSADLSITKTDGVTAATPGGSVTYTITASNAGPSDIIGATVTDTFPAALTCTWTCAGAGGGTCAANGNGNIGDPVNLPSGASTTYTANCAISATATGALTNTATVAVPAGATDPDPLDNAATDTDALGAESDLSITKTDGVTTVTAGDNVTYIIVASNAGPSAATGATVTDTFPASLTCAWTCAGAGGGTCAANGNGSIGDLVNLPSGASATYTANCSLSAAATGTLVNTATIEAPGSVTDPTPGNNTATDTDIIEAPGADPGAELVASKTVAGTFSAGGTVTYTVTLTNNGTAAQADNPGNELTDVLPSQLTLVSANATSGTAVTNVGTNTVTWNGAIPMAGSVTITITATIDAGTTGLVTNQAAFAYDGDGNGSNEASGTSDDPIPAGANDPTSFTVAGSANVAASKTVTGNFQRGGAVVYTITLANSGSAAQADNPGNELTDVLPAELTLVTATANSGTAVATIATRTVTWNGAIPAGGSVTVTINATINANAIGPIVNQGTIAFDANGDGTNEATATTDDPGQPGAADGTGFSIIIVDPGAATPLVIPAMDRIAMLCLMLGLFGIAAWRRRG